MRVKARLSTSYMRQHQEPPVNWADDVTLKSLAMLFVGDPLIANDDKGWFLSAGPIDRADELLDGTGTDVAQNILKDVNSVAALLRVEHDTVSIVDYDGLLDGVRALLTRARSKATDFTGLDSGSAVALLQLARREPWVHRVLELLQHVDHEWIWVDLWRVWDVIVGTFKSKKDFRLWVNKHAESIGDHFFDFERSANDPTFGSNRRHAMPVYNLTDKNKINPKTGQPGEMMTDAAALRFVKQVVTLWIERRFGIELETEWR